MSLQVLKTPSSTPDAGVFNLPDGFDTKKHAAEWVEETQIAAKEQRQVLTGAGYTADGWEIWKKTASSKPTVVATLSGKKYTLMCRDRGTQNEVNAAFGNVTKKLINREIQGESVAGSAKGDAGILTERQLPGHNKAAVEESMQPLNDEHGSSSKSSKT